VQRTVAQAADFARAAATAEMARRRLAAGMKGKANRAEARQSEGAFLATAKFRFDTPQRTVAQAADFARAAATAEMARRRLAAGSFIFLQ